VIGEVTLKGIAETGTSPIGVLATIFTVPLSSGATLLVSVTAAKNAAKRPLFTDVSGMLLNVNVKLAGAPFETPALTAWLGTLS
jgi:hypothetical protein